MIKLFTHHKVASNLLMAIMLISGVFALSKINLQFLPTFNVDVIVIKVIWQGATSEDVESSITNVIEQQIKNISNIKNINSNSSNNNATITIEFVEGVDMSESLNKVKDEVAKITNLPSDSKIPVVERVIVYDGVNKIILSTDATLQELRHYANQFKQDLLSLGIGKVDILGLPEQEILIEIKTETSMELGLSIANIAEQITQMSQDVPAGVLGFDEITRRLRTKSQGRSVLDFKNLLIKIDNQGKFLRLGEIAHIKKQDRRQQQQMLYQNRVAVQLSISEVPGKDILDAASIVNDWYDNIQKTLPPSLHIRIYDERWRLVKGRLNLLVANGATGLLLVALILFLFLNIRVAFWVAVGIPTALMATIAILYGVGGSINMLSMFALIMALGIIVDEAIVVGEDSLSRYQRGEKASLSAEKGALRMFAPVVSASLSTIASFLPLMIIGGIIGKILFDIPLVIVCVVLASLLETFLVLPGHLRHSMKGMLQQRTHPIREKLDRVFDDFRNGTFRRWISIAIENKRVVLALTIASLILGVALLAGGRLPFNFFPSPEGDIIKAEVSFTSGSPKSSVVKFISHLKQTLVKTDQELGGGLVGVALTELGRNDSTQVGDQFANMTVELIASEKRSVDLDEFIAQWKTHIKLFSGLEQLKISGVSSGPPGEDIELRFTGASVDKLKQAADAVVAFLKTTEGVLSTSNDLPYGQEQLIFSLNAEALSLGLSVSQISKQLRSAYDGHLVQTYTEGEDEIEVRVSIPEHQRNTLSSLESQMIILPSGQAVLLSNLIDYKSVRGFDMLRHSDGNLSVTVQADLDTDIVVAGTVISQLKNEILTDLSTKYGVNYSFQGQSTDQAETLSNMISGVILASILMYIVLAWVFSSYGWPFVVMSTIPFGLVGGLFGHWILGVDLTILSLFGLFGLSGIVVNDSIVLVSFYKELRTKGMPIKEAIIEAACQRLRAVLLTSLTTIGGLVPILFETSRQAQFLIPMAISISFGLAFATLLILFYIPSLLMIYEQIMSKDTPSG